MHVRPFNVGLEILGLEIVGLEITFVDLTSPWSNIMVFQSISDIVVFFSNVISNLFILNLYDYNYKN